MDFMSVTRIFEKEAGQCFIDNGVAVNRETPYAGQSRQERAQDSPTPIGPHADQKDAPTVTRGC